MRLGPAAAALLLVAAGGCSSGERSSFDTRPPASTSTSAAPSTTVGSTSSTIGVAGAVTFRVSGFSLPDVGAGGTGLRVLVRSSSERLTVRRRGGGGAVSVCPIAVAIPSPGDGACVDLPAGGGVELAFLGGFEARATAGVATVEELLVTYGPASRATTIVTPARPAGACVAGCEATFALVPGGAGAFVLDGQASGGRPRLVLAAVGAGVSNRTLATVEGGGSLSIRATLEAGSQAQLVHHEQTPDPVGPVTAEILWP